MGSVTGDESEGGGRGPKGKNAGRQGKDVVVSMHNAESSRGSQESLSAEALKSEGTEGQLIGPLARRQRRRVGVLMRVVLKAGGNL